MQIDELDATTSRRQPRWLARPRRLRLRVEAIEEGSFPDKLVAITFYSGEDLKSALVPAKYVDKDEKTTSGLLTGSSSDRRFYVVSLPPGTTGSSVALVPSDRFQELTVSD